jgi:RNA polymerase sigma factor (sigma-70 family)
MDAAYLPRRLRTGPLRSKRLLTLARDETLVLQMRRGNEAAFELAFERHGAGILGFCRHMLGSREEAEDAVQQTFAAAFRDLQRGEERTLALKPWLYTIARNRCISMLRARPEPFAEGPEPATAGLAEQVERRAELRDLLTDLRSLPNDQRAALLLSELGDLSHADVGEVLGCEVARVKALVYRARTGLLSRRAARDASCTEIRKQLANLRGGALRRNELRYHLAVCPGCRAYRERIQEQRRMLAAALPVAPTVGLKSSVLAGIGLGGGSAGGGLAGGGVAAGLGGLGAGGAAKVAAVGVLAGGSLVAGKAMIDERTDPPAPTRAGVTTAPARAQAELHPHASIPRPPVSGHPRTERRAPPRGEVRPHRGNGEGKDSVSPKPKDDAVRERPAVDRSQPEVAPPRLGRNRAGRPAATSPPAVHPGRALGQAKRAGKAEPQPSGHASAQTASSGEMTGRGRPEPKPKPARPAQPVPPARGPLARPVQASGPPAHSETEAEGPKK